MSDSSSSDDHPDPGTLSCPGCGKVYRTRNSLTQHRRLYCRPDADPTNTCSDCGRSFGTFAGLQQHRRKAHSASYQAQVEAQDRRVVQPFSQLETLHIAQAEIHHEGTAPINVYLAGRFQRPLDEIRNLRKRRGYIALRAQLEADLKDAPDHPTGSPARFEDPEPSTSRSPPPPATWPSPPPAEVSPSEGHTAHGRQGDESFDGWNLSPPSTSTGRSLEQELKEAHLSPSTKESPTSQPPAGPPDPLPSSDDEEEIGVPDPVRDYIQVLITDPTTEPELARLGHDIIADDEALARTATTQLHEMLWTPPPPAIRGPPLLDRPPPTNRGNRSALARERRAHRFKRYQELYVKDKSALSNLVARGLEPGLPSAAPPLEDISAHYTEVFAGASPLDDGIVTDPKEPTPGLYAPILEKDVRAAVNDRRASNSSGPDGMSAAVLRGLPVRSITLLFNAMLYLGYIPPALKACRTTLIPKSDVDLANVGSWRPITVANILLRTMHRIISRRMSSLRLHSSQRGFVSLDGTMANAVILQAAIKTCRQASRPYSVTSLDLRKAFDTVPHSTIGRALRRFSVDHRLSRYIMESLSGCHTTVSAGGAHTGRIPILRGVKQGDPLSPLLFNLVLDELLCRLDTLPTGLQVGASTVAALAYADDILLLTPSPGDMRTLVAACVRFFEARSMELNANKCSNLTVKLLPSRSKLYLSAETVITLRATPIPRVTAEGNFKYLGHRYGFMGSDPPSTDSLRAALANLRRVPLKPCQKLVILQEYLLPRFLFGLQNPRVTISILDRADKIVRRTVKEILHLPLQTANALMYARRKDGGLGVMCLTARIPDIMLGRLRRLRETGDADVVAALDSDYIVSLQDRLSRFIRPYGSGQQQPTYWRHRLSTSASGVGLADHCGHPSTSRWIRDPPPYWSGGDFVLAVQLRTNTLPTRGGLHNVRLPMDARRCRGGCHRVETLCHVLQRCPATHHPRIARHDHAVRTLARATTKRGLPTEVEPSIRGTDGRLYKPDLLVRTPRQIHIIDVSINWESPRPLADHYNNKVATYSTPGFLSAVRARNPDVSIRVGAMVLGARGTWCPLNDRIMESLGLNRGVSESLISGVLHGGSIIHRAFSAAVWDNPRP